MSTPITAVMIGAGQRGLYAYGPYASEHPEQLKFGAIAEPDPVHRRRFAKAHSIPLDRQFDGWEDLLAQDQLADTFFNMTLAQMHHPSTSAALKAGYDVLLEQPMATTLADCIDLVQTAEQTGRLLQICSPLRHTPFFSTLHDVLASGQLGEIITVEHRQNIIYWHMAHNLVRGNLRNVTLAGPMILTTGCPDLDILQWNLGDRVQQLQSFGSLIHFRAENAPATARRRCTDGCPVEDCMYDARRIYLNLSNTGWPTTAISSDLSMIGRQRAIEMGPYGRCVYYCDNDVVDHQTVNMQFEGGTSVVLALHGHSHEHERTMRYDGTHATLRGKYGSGIGSLEIHGHLTNRWESVDIPAATSRKGGGDFGVVRTFIQAVRGDSASLTTARDILESHLLAFAAEEARLNSVVVNMDRFREKAEQ